MVEWPATSTTTAIYNWDSASQPHVTSPFRISVVWHRLRIDSCTRHATSIPGAIIDSVANLSFNSPSSNSNPQMRYTKRKLAGRGSWLWPLAMGIDRPRLERCHSSVGHHALVVHSPHPLSIQDISVGELPKDLSIPEHPPCLVHPEPIMPTARAWCHDSQCQVWFE